MFDKLLDIDHALLRSDPDNPQLFLPSSEPCYDSLCMGIGYSYTLWEEYVRSVLTPTSADLSSLISVYSYDATEPLWSSILCELIYNRDTSLSQQ